MNPAVPKSLQAVIEALGALPGVGPRSAERYAYFLLRGDPARSQAIAKSLTRLHDNVTYCPVTFALIESDQKLSPLYTNPRRDKHQVAVVADPFDIVAIEKTGSYSGTY